MKCNQCEALVINGVFCHEAGCPNHNKKLIDGDWVSIYQCDICGYDIVEGEVCSCYQEGGTK